MLIGGLMRAGLAGALFFGDNDDEAVQPEPERSDGTEDADDLSADGFGNLLRWCF